jgi:hypothetical protein
VLGSNLTTVPGLTVTVAPLAMVTAPVTTMCPFHVVFVFIVPET